MQLKRFMPEYIGITYLSWLNDKEKMKYSSQRLRDHTRDSAFAYLRSFDNSPNYFWAIFDGSKMVGTANAYIEDTAADIGLLIGEPNRGHGKQAWINIIDALAAMGISTITGGTHSDNIAMRKIMEGCGMTHTHDKDGESYYRMEV